jgi:MFS family permease
MEFSANLKDIEVNNIEEKPHVREFDPVAVNRLTRAIDKHIIPVIFIIYMLCYLDRVNIGFARLYHLEKDLNLSLSEYAWTLSIFFAGYVIFEVPSNLVIKKATPSRWIAIILMTWGIITVCLAATTNFAGLMAGRFFLGVAEAGLFPGLVFYLSFWYTRKEQAFRLGMLHSASCVAGIIAGPLSYGIGFLDGKGGLEGWQWIFIIEGLAPTVMGIATFWVLPNTPSIVNWLSNEDKNLIVSRLEADHTDSKATKFYKSQFIEALTDYKIYFYMLMYFGFLCPVYSLAQLLPTVLSGMGFNTRDTMLLTIPPYAIAAVSNIVVAKSSDHHKERCFHLMAPLTLSALSFLSLILVKDLTSQYIANLFAVVGNASATPILLAWLNNNMVGVTKSGTASAMVICFANLGGLVAGQLFSKSEAPYFVRSNIICMCLVLMTLVLCITLRFLLIRENKKLLANPPRREDREDNLDLTGFQYIL